MKAILLVSLILVASLCRGANRDFFSKPDAGQIERYLQNKAHNPEDYTFNPLHTGNKWYYNGENIDGEIPTHCGRRVLADSLINGIQHWFVHGSMTSEHFWEYNSADTVWAWGVGYYPCPDTVQVLYWCFSPDTYYSPFWSYGEPMYSPTGSLVNIFGETVMLRHYLGPYMTAIAWAEKFGPVWFEFDFGFTGLVGAQINGVQYGYVQNEDDINAPPMEFTTLQCYPNPFAEELKLDYSLGKPGLAELAVYNLKGQLVKRLVSEHKSKGSYSTAWNSISEAGSRLPSGVYILQLSIDGKLKSLKKATLVNK